MTGYPLSETYTFLFLGPGLPLGLGVPSTSVAGAALFWPGLGPGIPLRFPSLLSNGSASTLPVEFDVVSGFSVFSSGKGVFGFGVSEEDCLVDLVFAAFDFASDW